MQNYTAVFQTAVPKKFKEFFEKQWLSDILHDVSGYKGYRYRTVHLLTSQGDYLEYAVCLNFDSIENLSKWVTSPNRQARIDKLNSIGGHCHRIGQYGGASQKISTSTSPFGSKTAISDNEGGNSVGSVQRIELQDLCSIIPRPLPPPKWKLTILIYLGVLACVVNSSFGGSLAAMAAAGFPTGLIILIDVMQSVPVMVYALMPIVISIPVVNNWLRAPRCPPEQMSPLHSLLDQGLQIFAERKDPVPPALLQRVDRLEGRVNRLRRANYNLTIELEKTQSVIARRLPITSDYSDGEDSLSRCNSSEQLLTRVDSVTNWEAMNSNGIEVKPFLSPHKGKPNWQAAHAHSCHNSPADSDGYILTDLEVQSNTEDYKRDGFTHGQHEGLKDSRAAAMDGKSASGAAVTTSAVATTPTAGGGHSGNEVGSINSTFSGPADLEEEEEEMDKLAALGVRKVVPVRKMLRQASIRMGQTADISEPLTMVVRHYVKWERALDFERWTDEMDAEMSRYAGYQGMIRIAPKKDGDPYINSFTFDSLANMLQFTEQSRIRLELLKRLEGMLEATSEAEINQERVIQDAFTELFVATGESAASRPPPLWKTCILTVVPLMLIIWLAGVPLGGSLSSLGLDPWLVLVLSVIMSVFVNSYIGVPLMLSQFGDWLRAPSSPPPPPSSSPSSRNSSFLSQQQPQPHDVEGGQVSASAGSTLRNKPVSSLSQSAACSCNAVIAPVTTVLHLFWRYLDEGFPVWMQYLIVLFYFGLHSGLGGFAL